MCMIYLKVARDRGQKDSVRVITAFEISLRLRKFCRKKTRLFHLGFSTPLTVEQGTRGCSVKIEKMTSQVQTRWKRKYSQERVITRKPFTPR